ncbi:GNAT family N-acetyltransferase [Cellulomonas endophytica]|uniref:GNAT family N-acetyltransferase n=1 Tax=Cellulomonas endophytica TaxID=2494735 RepID=UPI00101097E1|nr:GNAT family protein [Cellulomonas endophytica]
MTPPDGLAALWPPAGLRLRSGDLELRWPDDALLLEVAALAGRGIHDPGAMPFTVPWTRGTPEEVARSVLRYQWAQRAAVEPASWTLELVVLRDGVPVGLQGVSARDFPVLRTAVSGSWLGREHQGRGTGSRMRVLVLHLLFEGLGARAATTDAFADNPASLGVTRRLGYRPDGVQDLVRDGAPARSLRFRLDRAGWEARPAALRPEVATEGVEALRAFLAVDGPGGDVGDVGDRGGVGPAGAGPGVSAPTPP